MKRKFCALFALGFLSCVNCFALDTHNKPSFTHLDKIVVIVNREAISLSQVNKEIDQAKKHFAQINEPIPPAGELKKLAIDNLIAKSLQMQLCQARGLKLKPEELDNAIETIAKSNKLTLPQLKTAIEQTGMNYDDYKAQMSDQLLIQKLQQEEVAKTVLFTPDDVKKFMQENKDKLNRYNAFHVVDILFPVNETETASQLTQVKKQATELTHQLQTGKDLDMTLQEYPNAQKNDLGWRSFADIPSLFQKKVAAMSIKSISTPVQAPNGFHILQLVEARGENIKPTEAQIKNLVFQQKMIAAVKDWVQQLRHDAYIKFVN